MSAKLKADKQVTQSRPRRPKPRQPRKKIRGYSTRHQQRREAAGKECAAQMMSPVQQSKTMHSPQTATKSASGQQREEKRTSVSVLNEQCDREYHTRHNKRACHPAVCRDAEKRSRRCRTMQKYTPNLEARVVRLAGRAS